MPEPKQKNRVDERPFRSHPSSMKIKQNSAEAGSAALAELLSRAVAIPTVSYADSSKTDTDKLEEFQAFLAASFPAVHSKLRKESLSRFSLIYRWQGSDASLKPALFLAHYDVVPAGDVTRWSVDPFGGEVRDGFVWGRGTLDDKQVLISLLYAAEGLLAEGFVPRRTIVFAFGGDEEVTGRLGAARTAELFRDEGLRFEFVLDEGGVVADGVIKPVAVPAALIGTAEKGIANIELSVKGQPGHSAMPPRHSAAGILARAVCRIEEDPSPLKLTKTVRLFLERLSAGAAPGLRTVLAHPVLFESLLKKILSATPKTAALVRTTAAVTMLQASEAENVLPSMARAVVNVRTLPGDAIAAVIKRFESTIADETVHVGLLDKTAHHEPSRESSVGSYAYGAIAAAALRLFPDAIAAPYLVSATTDSKWYEPLAEDVYRFVPMKLSAADLDRIHGFDERISMENLDCLHRFYTELFAAI
jgi:carboxypeptidase PM20D1